MKEENQNFGETHYAINHANMCIIEVSELEGKKQGEKNIRKNNGWKLNRYDENLSYILKTNI